MSKPRKIVDARADAKGNITQVLLSGNSNFLPVEKVIPMADRGEIAHAHVVRPSDREAYLRTNKDSSTANNLDAMAGDKE